MLLLAERITSGDSLESGFLGVNIADPTTGRPGALITGINPASPAEAAGVQDGDLVVAIDGDRRPRPVRARGEGAPHRTGEARSPLTVERDGTEVDLVVTLGALGSG